MKELSEVELRVLQSIKPRAEEYNLIWSTCERVMGVLKEVLKEHSVQADVTVQGSVAHDTWLSGDRDIDVFVLFPEKWGREDLENKGFPLILEAAKRIGNYETLYAEHPYVRIRIDDVEVDVVPGLKLNEPARAKTAVDRTPFHTMYVNSVLTSELKDRVRLLKKFMKAIGVYGAEVKTRGFSGYAVELLVAVYGGFREVLEEAASWKPPVFVNTLGGKFTSELVKALKSKYPDSCIYMPDPVDPMRNVTASVSLKSLVTFIVASKCYLKSPDVVFFVEPADPDLGELMEALKDRCIVAVTYSMREPLPPDVMWGEIQRVASRLAKLLEVLGFNVIDYSAWTNEKDVCVLIVELDACTLRKYKHYRGPCVFHEDERVFNFIRKHVGSGYGPWITREGCLESLGVRGEVDVTRILESKWSEYSVSPHLRSVKPSVEVANEDVISRLLKAGAGKWLRSFILKTPTWMEKCIS